MSDDNEAPVLPCYEKLAFDSPEQARAAALTAQWQHDAALKPYRCTYCHLWHLSSKTPSHDD